PGPARQVAACTSECLYIGCGPSSPQRPGQETEMPSFRHTIDIAATPEQVWRVLGDLTSVARWIPGVTKVARTDTGRVCTLGTTPTICVASRGTTASGPPARASSSPAAMRPPPRLGYLTC